MSNTPLHEAAIEVLKNHAQEIKATNHTIDVRLRAQSANDVVVQEVNSALRALSDKIAVTVERNDTGGITAKVNSSIPADNTLPVKQLATMLADSGVNFPGSTNYKTPGLGNPR
jgi:hypothetical protein